MESQCNGLPPCILVSMFPCFLASNAKLCVYPSSSVFDPIPLIIRSRCGTGSSGHNGTRHCSVTLSLSTTMEILPKCRNFQGCGQFAKTPRATLCASCFTAQAARSGTQSRGNVSPLINEGNKGNPNPKVNRGNKGNTKNHDSAIKGKAGKRSGVKRSSKIALVVKKQWLEKILSGEKDWEIRSRNTLRRGWIHLAQSRGGSRLLGRVQLVDSFELTKTEFIAQKTHHCVPCSSEMPYKRMYAWVLENAQRFPKLFGFEHAKGAVIWVKV